MWKREPVNHVEYERHAEQIETDYYHIRALLGHEFEMLYPAIRATDHLEALEIITGSEYVLATKI